MEIVIAIGQWVNFVLNLVVLFFCFINFKRQCDLLENDEKVNKRWDDLEYRVSSIEVDIR